MTSHKIRSSLLLSASLLAISTTPLWAQTTDTTAGKTEDTASYLSLGKIVVTSGKQKVATDTPQSVTVMDQEDIDQDQSATVGDLLETVPGVDAAGGTSSVGQGLNIRGMGTALSESDSRVVLNVDGVTKFFEAYRMGTMFSDTELFKRVEVLRGPSSSTIHGTGALAGTVNFVTKDASDFLSGTDKFAFRLKGTYDSNSSGSLVSIIMATKPTQNLDVLLVANKRDFPNYSDGKENEVNPSQANGDSVLVKSRYYINGNRDHSLWASVQKWSDDSWQIYDQQAAFSGALVQRLTEDTNLVLGYDNGFSENDLLDIKAQIAVDESSTLQSDNQFAPNSLGYSSEYSYSTVQAKLENVSNFKTGAWEHFLTSGIQVYNQERRNPRYTQTGSLLQNGATTHPEGDMKRSSLYLQDEIIIGDRLTLIPGIRYDKTKFIPGAGTYIQGTSGTASEVTLDATSPKLAVLFSVTKSLNLFASVAQTKRLPVLDEVYTRGSSSASGQTISLNLEPEDSMNKEIGLAFVGKGVFFKGDRFNLKATAYNNTIDNLITRDSTTSSAYSNVGKARYEGAEIEAEYVKGSLFSRASWSTVNGYNRLTGIAFNTIPAEQINATIGYAYPEQNLTLGWSGEIAEKQNAYSQITGTLSRSGSHKSYVVHNLFATYRPQAGLLNGIELRINVDNLFDIYYQRHLSALAAPGQTVRLSLARTF